MTEQPRMMIMVGSDEIKALRDELTALRKILDGAIVTPADEWERIPDHAKRAGVQPQTVRLWIRKGQIDSKRVGAVTYVRRG